MRPHCNTHTHTHRDKELGQAGLMGKSLLMVYCQCYKGRHTVRQVGTTPEL